MADRKTSEPVYNPHDGSDARRPMVIQSTQRQYRDTGQDLGSNSIKDHDKHRHKDFASKKSPHSKSPHRSAESGSEIYTFHESREGSPLETPRFSKTAYENVHHKKRSKVSVPKAKEEYQPSSNPVLKLQASHSTLEALMARAPLSQEQMIPISDRTSPVGTFVPSQAQTKSASLSRDISPSRITAQVVSALSESNSYSPVLLHSALTGKLTESPSPPNRTVVRGVPLRDPERPERLGSQTIKQLQEAQILHASRIPFSKDPAELDRSALYRYSNVSSHAESEKRLQSVKPSKPVHRGGEAHGHRSVSPMRGQGVSASEAERFVPSFRSVSPKSSHVRKEDIRHRESESPISHSSVSHQPEFSLPMYTSTVLNSVPSTVVYSHSFVRGPPVSSVGPVSVSGPIPSVREVAPGMRLIASSDMHLPPNLQKVMVSMADNPGLMPREVAERLEAEIRSHQAAQKRTPPLESRLPKEQAGYARHLSSSQPTMHRSHSPQTVSRGPVHSPHIVQRIPSPHAGHRIQGRISPVAQSQFMQGKVSPVPVQLPRHSSPSHKPGKVSPVPSYPSAHRSSSPASAHQGRHGHVSPVQIQQAQHRTSPPPAHKHPELLPTCRSGQPAVDLSKAHVKDTVPFQTSVPKVPGLPQVQFQRSSHLQYPPDLHDQELDRADGIHSLHRTHPQSQQTSAAYHHFVPEPIPVESKPLPPHINPFTFPVKLASTQASVKVPSYTISTQAKDSVAVSKQKTPPTAPFFPRSASDASQLKHSVEKQNQNGMPRLVPEVSLAMIKREDLESEMKCARFNHINEDSHEHNNDVLSICPFNMRLQNLANFPVNNSTYRSAYRAQSVAVQRAKACSITSAAKSLDLLRQNLQKCINKEIDKVIQDYMDRFFKPAIANIKLNNGQNAVSEEHIHAVCRQILEEAKKVYVVESPRRSVTPVRDDTDTVSETGSNNGSKRSFVTGRRRRPSDSNSEAGSDIGVPKKKKKGRPPLSQSGRGGAGLKSLKPNEPVRREGPKWDPDRLTPDTKFVMGARANKALGLGATRGRLYIKHPDVFKYSGDQDDKSWLYEHHLMPATGGKAYMLVVEDIHDLSQTDEYRDSPNLLMDELYGFTVPEWILSKMKIQMNAMRTDLGRSKFPRSRSATPSDIGGFREGEEEPPKTLPFSNFSDNNSTYLIPKSEPQTSPTEDMEFLSTADNDDSTAPDLSPFNVTGGFDEASPSPPEVDNLDDPSYVLK